MRGGDGGERRRCCGRPASDEMASGGRGPSISGPGRKSWRGPRLRALPRSVRSAPKRLDARTGRQAASRPDAAAVTCNARVPSSIAGGNSICSSTGRERRARWTPRSPRTQSMSPSVVATRLLFVGRLGANCGRRDDLHRLRRRRRRQSPSTQRVERDAATVAAPRRLQLFATGRLRPRGMSARTSVESGAQTLGRRRRWAVAHATACGEASTGTGRSRGRRIATLRSPHRRHRRRRGGLRHRRRRRLVLEASSRNDVRRRTSRRERPTSESARM